MPNSLPSKMIHCAGRLLLCSIASVGVGRLAFASARQALVSYLRRSSLLSSCMRLSTLSTGPASLISR